MAGHIHAGVIFVLAVAAAMILILATTRTLVLHFPDKAPVKGLAFLFS